MQESSSSSVSNTSSSRPQGLFSRMRTVGNDADSSAESSLSNSASSSTGNGRVGAIPKTLQDIGSMLFLMQEQISAVKSMVNELNIKIDALLPNAVQEKASAAAERYVRKTFHDVVYFPMDSESYIASFLLTVDESIRRHLCEPSRYVHFLFLSFASTPLIHLLL
jgi:hypothetical protein